MSTDSVRPLETAASGELEETARRLARRHKRTRRSYRRPVLLDALHRNEQILNEIHRCFATAPKEQLVFLPAAEWILDNFHLVQESIREVREDLPGGYYRELPKLEADEEAGIPAGQSRIYSIARELVRWSNGELSLDEMRRFVESYDQVEALTMGELWAFPTMLRMATLENLAGAAARVWAAQAGTESAAEPAPGHPPEDRKVAAGITCLRTLDRVDWKSFFEAVSRTERTLRKDPAEVYGCMDFETRDRYRKAVERLARLSGQDEEHVAAAAVQLAREAVSNSRENHVGFYLVDDGLTQLESRIGFSQPAHARLGRRLLRHALILYVGGIALISAALIAALVVYLGKKGANPLEQVIAGILWLVPATTVAVGLANWLVTRMLPPRILPKMDLEAGIPADHRGMVVIPALLTKPAEVASLLRQIECHYLANTGQHLGFALLGDFADAPERDMPGDDELVKLAESGIDDLNRRYAAAGHEPFYFFHRCRQWNAVEGCWMGWERKRGKLHEFNRLLRGAADTSHTVCIGDLTVLTQVRYVITLDADTVLPNGNAQRLVAAMAHPLNRAEFDPRTGAVMAGYTIMQPRVEIKPESSNRSLFARVFAGDTGLDLYTRAVSDVYQDLFGDGIYVGKGIYDVDAFERCLQDRVPENALLSHDLFEGGHGRVGLLTDVMLLEDFPPHYIAYMRRAHRWIRGDWQLLPWLAASVPARGGGKVRNRLSALGRWKALDNLRRSLVAPAIMGWLVAIWLWMPGPLWLWMLIALLTPGIPVMTSLFDRLNRHPGTLSLSVLVRMRRDFLRWLFAVIFLPYEASVCLDAIISTLIRMYLTRKGLLQWITAAHTLSAFGGEPRPDLTWRSMMGATALAAALAAAIGFVRPGALPAAAALLVGWLVSPQMAYWISRPTGFKADPLDASERRQLHRLARRTWLFYEHFVGPEDNWLPPDHFQEAPLGVVAHRTSPTNIGLYAVSCLAAYDLGYIGAFDLRLRLRLLFDTLDRLERYRGHLLNWYDTRALRPLPPRYASFVDSGNLAACLIVLSRACAVFPGKATILPERWDGFVDTLDLISEAVESSSANHSEQEQLLDHLAVMRRQALDSKGDVSRWARTLSDLYGKQWRELDRLLVHFVEAGKSELDVNRLKDLRAYAETLRHHLRAMQRSLTLLLPWLAVLLQPPRLLEDSDPGSGDRVVAAIAETWRSALKTLLTLPNMAGLPSMCQTARRQVTQLRDMVADSSLQGVAEARRWLSRLGQVIDSSAETVAELLADYEALGRRAEIFFEETDFSFLFDEQRRLCRIGYNVDAGRPDANYYDLLASESRLASYVAIAKGDLPSSHWMQLGRPLTSLDGKVALVSWSGTMFEYLMPSLWMRDYPHTLLDESAGAVLEYQISYGHRRGIPWGVSESGYYRFDAGQSYQYRAFGVAGLGFKRGLGDDMVVAPYASLLALSRNARAVMRNLAHLSRLGMMGRYGLYEAVDFTPARLPRGSEFMRISSFMAHHQAMILVSLANYLRDGFMTSLFHNDPRVESNQLLLQEQVPHQAPLQRTPSQEVHDVRPVRRRAAISAWRVPEDPPLPLVHVLSNGRLSVMLTSAGAGCSTWQQFDLTRWRADSTLDDTGTWIYIKDADAGDVWSAAYQPTAAASEHQETFFGGHYVEFRRRAHGILSRTEISVAPDEDVEIRRVTLVNETGETRSIVLTSYAEIVLAPHADDSRHPAFNKLFITSEHLRTNGFLFSRRLRSDEEAAVCLAHFLVAREEVAEAARHETDRGRFLGRGGSPRAPAALARDSTAPGIPGASLDPIMSLGQRLTLGPHKTAELAYVTAAAGSRPAVLRLARHYRSWSVIDRSFEHARHQSEIELRQIGLKGAQLQHVQQLLSALLYPYPALREDAAVLAANSKGQPDLWAYGISGDHPILLVRLGGPTETDLVYELLQAHAYWRNRQIKITLLFLNEWDTGYQQEVAEQLAKIFSETGSDAWLNRHDGIFVLRADQIPDVDRKLLATAARAVLDSRKGSLANQLNRLLDRPARLPAFVPAPHGPIDEMEASPVERPSGLCFDNGLGGFSEDHREYVIYLRPGQRTPAPWINVIANPRLGFLVSESGSGYTWAENSGENRLTPWRNDPVGDQPGEALYLRDEETAEIWSPSPLPVPAQAPYLVRHGAGYTVFEHRSHGVHQQLRLFCAPDEPVKFVQLRLQNLQQRQRRLTATYYAEWVLGVAREATQQYLVPEFEPETRALLARNAYNVEFAGRVAFLAANSEPHGLTADRTEFLGRMGDLARPAGLGRIGLASTVRADTDTCAAIQLHVDLAPGEVQEIHFLLGQGGNREDSVRLIKRYQDPKAVEDAWRGVTAFWDETLGAITVRTPEPAIDIMLNRWLLYQAVSCRVWARSALYQSSGAFGYRDQLQDVMALDHVLPDVARTHILESARRQFEEGDVLHWWHPRSGRGVRTRCSDDLLWLPYVTAHYVSATGDDSILRERVPFLKGQPLKPEEVERYGYWETTQAAHSVYEHCCRAIRKGSTSGPHRLPLIGTGDWNDGLNRVGIRGIGESVWLGWFLHAVLTQFAPLCLIMEDPDMKDACLRQARELRKALESYAWDGGWYRRAYYDDRTPLGSAENRECRIDSIAQSWGVLSGAANPGRARQAMEAVADQLVRREEKLCLLFTPPFDKTSRDPGYIKGYPPGIRENGGQYTHAAMWAAWAFAEVGNADLAAELFRLLNPIGHGDKPERVSTYRVEPYVVAADVYSTPPHVGRGGWSWYTGSASWMYRLGVERILGLQLRGKSLVIDPRIPAKWPGYKLSYRLGPTLYNIEVQNPHSVSSGVAHVVVDGEPVAGGAISLVQDGRQHDVLVLLGDLK